MMVLFYIDEVDMEKWKTIPEYEGRYEVSDAGRVRSISGGRWGVQPSRILKNSMGNHGYPVVNIRKDTETKPLPRLVHRLVALAFLGECPEGQQVRHRNGDRSTPRLRNIEYGTQADNEADKKRHGTARTSDCFLATLDGVQVGAIRRLLEMGYRPVLLSETFRVSRQTICDISKGRSWRSILPSSTREALRVFSLRKGGTA